MSFSLILKKSTQLTELRELMNLRNLRGLSIKMISEVSDHIHYCHLLMLRCYLKILYLRYRYCMVRVYAVLSFFKGSHHTPLSLNLRSLNTSTRPVMSLDARDCQCDLHLKQPKMQLDPSERSPSAYDEAQQKTTNNLLQISAIFTIASKADTICIRRGMHDIRCG